ncbi:uncharacterized protein Triagg1_6768 [Trichoderma aggressivum f. europaeum]|uniref:Uncharacterized protein n=1 Tax=Trichoderma aggressivum f. europaeum TaxID=173218 RepID=A0AAE1M1L4_9HYPO|nr:hypothetical protein Triagg1_6768 [Trichoderma aggressivum f. europaeum]
MAEESDVCQAQNELQPKVCMHIQPYAHSGVPGSFDSTELHSASLSSGIPALTSRPGESDRTTIGNTKQPDGTSAMALAVRFGQSDRMLVAPAWRIFFGNKGWQATGAPLNPIWWTSESKTPAA